MEWMDGRMGTVLLEWNAGCAAAVLYVCVTTAMGKEETILYRLLTPNDYNYYHHHHLPPIPTGTG
jgi:hypothetical protein